MAEITKVQTYAIYEKLIEEGKKYCDCYGDLVEPGIIKISICADPYDNIHNIIDDYAWDVLGCYKTASQINYDDYYDMRVTIHWFWFDDGEKRKDDFKGNMDWVLSSENEDVYMEIIDKGFYFDVNDEDNLIDDEGEEY